MNPYYEAMGACGPFGCGPGVAGPNPYYGGGGYGGWGMPNRLAIVGQTPQQTAQGIQAVTQGDAPAADNRTFTEKTSDWLNKQNPVVPVANKWVVVGATAAGIGAYGYSQGWWLSGRDEDEDGGGYDRDRSRRRGGSSWFGDAGTSRASHPARGRDGSSRRRSSRERFF